MTLMVLQKSFRRPAKSLKFLTEVLLKNNAGFRLSTKSGLNSYFACKMVVLKLSYYYDSCKMIVLKLSYYYNACKMVVLKVSHCYNACKMVVLKLSYCYNACKMVNGELLYSAGKRQASAEWLKKSRFKLMKRLFLYSTIQY